MSEDELLRRINHRHTWRDDVREFIFDLRANPRLALICTFAGLAVGFAASFGVAEIIILVTR